MYDPFAHFESTTMPSGLRVHVLHKPEIPFARMQLVIHNGTNDDPKGKAGIAHFLEHIICANSGKSLPQMINYFADEGGGFVANTNHYRTCYGFLAPLSSPKFDEFLHFWTNAVVVNPIEDYFEREQRIIRSEIARSFPSAQVMENNQTAHYLTFRGEPFGEAVSALGTKESFDSIGQDDLLLQRRKMYIPQNIDMVCVGGLSLEQVVQKIDKTALSWRKVGSANQPLQKTAEVPALIQPRFVGECNDLQNMGVTNVQKTFMLPGTLNH
jgi:predicted Zn-dependent peptidase